MLSKLQKDIQIKLFILDFSLKELKYSIDYSYNREEVLLPLYYIITLQMYAFL